MDGALSQEQIDLLVNGSLNSNENDETESVQILSNISSRYNKQRKENKLYKQIDFRKPNKLQYENLGPLKQIHEHFTKSLNNFFPVSLKGNIQVDVNFEAMEQITYNKFVNANNKNKLWFSFGLTDKHKEQGKCFLCYDIPFCNFFLERVFGGSRPFSEYANVEEKKVIDINKQMSKKLFEDTLKFYEEAWNNSGLFKFAFKYYNIESNLQNLNIGLMSTEMMIVIPMKIEIAIKSFLEDDDEEEETEIYNCNAKIGIPYQVMDPLLDKINSTSFLEGYKENGQNEKIKPTLEKISNKVEVFVGETVEKFEQFSKLEVGDIISLNTKKDNPYPVLIGGVKKFEGTPCKLQKRICIQITKNIEN